MLELLVENNGTPDILSKSQTHAHVEDGGKGVVVHVGGKHPCSAPMGFFLSCMNDGSLREHLNGTPDVTMERVDTDTETFFKHHKKEHTEQKAKLFKSQYERNKSKVFKLREQKLLFMRTMTNGKQ